MLAAREWHRIVGEGKFGAGTGADHGTLVADAGRVHVVAARASAGYHLALRHVRGAGASALFRRSNPLWQAGGVLYLGFALRSRFSRCANAVPHGAWLIGGLFVVVWATDTGAFVIGNLIGGPKLAPELVAEQDVVGHARRHGGGGA